MNANEPAIWLNEDEGSGEMNCGCVLHREYGDSDNPALVLCPMHDNAEALMLVCHEVAKLPPAIKGRCVLCGHKPSDDSVRLCGKCAAGWAELLIDKANEALRKATKAVPS